MAIQRLNTNTRLSQAAFANGFVLTASVVPDDVTHDITGQTQQVLAKIENLLRRAGSDKTKPMSATIYLPAFAAFAAMNAVWDAWLAPGCAPSRACVIAGLANPAWRAEISGVATA